MTNAPQPSAYIALLRGINVGGKNKLPMVALKAMFEAIGCTDVRTYIQSGNVVFRAAEADATKVPEHIQGAIHARFGYTIPIVLRTAEELSATVAANPYGDQEADERFLHVGFLAQAPDADIVAGLDHAPFAPDVFTIIGRAIYLHYPNGSARTKLTNAYFDRRLDTVSTMRNWRTTKKLLAMVQE